MKRNEGRECWRVKGLLLFNCKSTRPSINHSENKIKICKTTKEELLIFTSPASAPPPTDSSTPRTTPQCKLKLPRYVSASPPNFVQVDENGKMTGTKNAIIALAGFMRQRGEADACLNRLFADKDLLSFRR